MKTITTLTFLSILSACSGGSGDDATFVPGGDFPPAGASLVFASIGDYGDTGDLADGETNTLQVAKLVKSWDPDFIVTVGDNDYTDGEFAGSFTGLDLGVGQYFAEYIGDYRGTKGTGAAENRFFPIPGDHDYGDDCDNPRLGDYLDYFTLPVGETDETYYDVRRGPVHIFTIDSIEECHQDGGAKLAAERAWLERTARASDAPYKIVLIHQPPFSSGARHGSNPRTQWPYADWGIQLVMSGDDHIYERIEKDGVTYLVNGLGGVEKHDIGAPIEGSQVRYNAEYGAVGLAVLADRLEVAFVSVTGVLVDRFTISNPSLDWFRPALDTTWQWQLQGTIDQSYDVDLYDVDLFETDQGTIDALHAAGRRVICYFSAGSYEDFRADRDAFAATDLGSTLDGYPHERWLDVRTESVRSVMRARLDLAAAKQCDGVEPDNVDGYSNDTGFPLTGEDQLAFDRFLAAEAHGRGLAVGLKNDLDQVATLVDDFDFSLDEQCHEYDECELLQPFVQAGKPVFVAEYLDRYVSDTGERDALCASSRSAGLHTLVLPVDLDDSFRYSCEP